MKRALTQEQVKERIQQCIGNHILCIVEEKGETIVTLKLESIDQIREICTILRDDEILSFDYLSFLAGIDYLKYPTPPPHNCRFEVFYQMFSVEGGHHLRMKVPVPERDGKLFLYSVTPVWRSAEFSEMEVYDMFGISFDGHPDMRRLYLPEDWEGHPLRKDYDIRKGQEYGVRKAKELETKHAELLAEYKKEKAK
jgi:NADH-quinone oxidoreductase subunit C